MNLDDYMKANSISTRQAAKQLGASRALVSRWRRGLVTPGREWWLKIQAWSTYKITKDVK